MERGGDDVRHTCRPFRGATMRVPRRQVALCVGLASCVGVVTLLLSAGRPDPSAATATAGHTDTPYPDPDHVMVGSLQQNKNASPFDIPPGFDPYPWHFFVLERWRRQVLVPGDGEVQRPPMPGPEAAELTAVLEAALAEVRFRTGNGQYSAADSLGGRFRLVPGAGVQYEVYFRTRDAAPGNFHTVLLSRQLEPLAAWYVGETSGRLVNVILPYYRRLDTLGNFVERFVQLVQSGQQAALTVVRYADGFPSVDEAQRAADRAGVARLVGDANRQLGGDEPRVRLVEQAGVFSRGGALMAGAAAWDSRDDVLLFLCDVDIVFGEDLLQRCRANAAPAQKAYFPVVFSAYNPEIVYGVVKKKVVSVLTNYKQKKLINRELGYWIDFGFGMSCQYLSDFRRLSGPFLNITGWGLEDVRLYEQFQRSSIEIVRMPDPDLVHVYHKKQCSKYEVGKRFNSCLKSKALNEASRLEWGLWVYKSMGDTDDVEKFLKIFRAAQSPEGQ